MMVEKTVGIFFSVCKANTDVYNSGNNNSLPRRSKKIKPNATLDKRLKIENRNVITTASTLHLNNDILSKTKTQTDELKFLQV